MIIAVCMKQVSYLYARTGRDPELNFVGPRDHVRLNNPLDEVAWSRPCASRNPSDMGRSGP